MSLKEVAKLAGVSTATVSRVLNNTISVKSSTRARVMRAVAELNYHPNIHAQTLAGGKSRTIGMIASNLENPFFFDIFRTLENDAHAHGYEVVIANTDYRPEQLALSIRMMLGRRVAGLAVIVSEMTPELARELVESKIPIVFYDVPAPQPHLFNIHVTYRRGIERIVDYLHTLGHHRLAFIGHHSALRPTGERERAFTDAVSRFAPHSEWKIATNQDGPEGGRHAVRELLGSGFNPSAIVCVNDFMALGVLRELRESGLRVPQDISVTGFDNIKLSEFCHPQLTTVHIPREQIGHLVFERLAPETAKTRTGGREILIDPELVLRESTGP
ncbi:MAG TPA: LacI family DNA-binding transcriptional regulator, partial [Blastocatellia bacterium]|nr:LacI family DNA-binding transcriptional regulator [Blastocatellia bacterium]